jgi:hypothetical protein
LIRAERRISLTTQEGKKRKDKEEYAQYSDDSSSATFGDLLQQQFDNKQKE